MWHRRTVLRTVRNVVSRDLEEEAYHIGRTRKRYRRREHCRSGGRHGYIGRSPAEYKVGNNLQANPVGLVGSHIEDASSIS